MVVSMNERRKYKVKWFGWGLRMLYGCWKGGGDLVMIEM